MKWLRTNGDMTKKVIVDFMREHADKLHVAYLGDKLEPAKELGSDWENGDLYRRPVNVQNVWFDKKNRYEYHWEPGFIGYKVTNVSGAYVVAIPYKYKYRLFDGLIQLVDKEQLSNTHKTKTT